MTDIYSKQGDTLEGQKPKGQQKYKNNIRINGLFTFLTVIYLHFFLFKYSRTLTDYNITVQRELMPPKL